MVDLGHVKYNIEYFYTSWQLQSKLTLIHGNSPLYLVKFISNNEDRERTTTILVRLDSPINEIPVGLTLEKFIQKVYELDGEVYFPISHL